MNIIDSHLHLWNPDQFDYPWLKHVPAIRKPFLIADYQQATQRYAVQQMVFVQCECCPEQALAELDFVMDQNGQDGRIAGMVAYAPLEQGENVANYLTILTANPLVRGVRRMTEAEPGLCLTGPFLTAVRLLPSYRLSLDVSIKPFQMEETLTLMEQCPDTQFILDHLGKPAIREGGLSVFRDHIDRLARLPNVVAKLSGLVTEADWTSWQPDDLRPYVEYALERFGPDRLLFGSDWPVVLLASTLTRWFDTLQRLLSGCSVGELAAIYSQNAQRVYRLTV